MQRGLRLLWPRIWGPLLTILAVVDPVAKQDGGSMLYTQDATIDIIQHVFLPDRLGIFR